MQIDNHTSYPAHMFRTTFDDEDRIAASIFVRVTYDLLGDRLSPADEQSWIVSPAPWNCEYGMMESDDVFIKGGVDFMIFGHARPPGGQPAQQMQVRIQVNENVRMLTVFGDRFWQQQGDALIPSAPQRFDAMPLSAEHAFGGKDQWDGLDIPFPDNPDGKGYYISKENALGKPLPNIEDPNHLVARWDDQPAPAGVGTCPPGHSKRFANLEYDERGLLKKLGAGFYNAAYPDMVLPKVMPNDYVTISGVRAAGPMGFALPASHLLVRLQFGDEVIEREPQIDQIGIEPDRDRVFISYRYPFRYVIYPLQKRSCELLDLRTGRQNR